MQNSHVDLDMASFLALVQAMSLANGYKSDEEVHVTIRREKDVGIHIV